MKYTYKTHGTCSKQITYEIDDNGKIRNVSFLGGCNGNLQGIGLLVDGMDALDVVIKLKGVNCNGRGTSCPDQLAKAISENIK